MNKESIDLMKEDIEILNELYERIKANPQDCLLDTIKDFCFDKNLELEYVGSLVGSNEDLKSYAEKNLTKYKFIQKLEIPKPKKGQESEPVDNW